MFKTSPQLADALPTIGIDNSKIVSSSGRNNEISAQSDKPVHGMEEPNFWTPNAR